MTTSYNPAGEPTDALIVPELVHISAGAFLMGSPEEEIGRLGVEGPRRVVTIRTPLAVSRYPVTVGQMAAYAADAGYPRSHSCKCWDGEDWRDAPGSFSDPGFAQDESHPAVCVSWHEARAYADWLAHKTGQPFRLLTEAEWEYAARAGTTTAYWWGDTPSPERANYDVTATYGPGKSPGSKPSRTVPVQRFEADPWGLHQMLGNVWEWVEDCWQPGYDGAPADATARLKGGDCSLRVLRGGSWFNGGRGIRCARRHAAMPEFRRGDVGFRVGMTI